MSTDYSWLDGLGGDLSSLGSSSGGGIDISGSTGSGGGGMDFGAGPGQSGSYAGATSNDVVTVPGDQGGSSGSSSGDVNWGNLLQNAYQLYSGLNAGHAAKDVFSKADPFAPQRSQYQAALQQLVFQRPDNPFMTKLATAMVNAPANPYMTGLYSFMQNNGLTLPVGANPGGAPQTSIASGNYRFQPGPGWKMPNLASSQSGTTPSSSGTSGSVGGGSSGTGPTKSGTSTNGGLTTTVNAADLDNMRNVLKQNGYSSVDGMSNDAVISLYNAILNGTQGQTRWAADNMQSGQADKPGQVSMPTQHHIAGFANGLQMAGQMANNPALGALGLAMGIGASQGMEE